MAKSNIIKQLANDEISLEIALNRLLIIASDIENDKLAEWVEHELNGYSKNDVLPDYRKIRIPYFVYTGIKKGVLFDKMPLPLDYLFSPDEKDYAEKAAATNFLEGINALKSLTSNSYEILYYDYTYLANFALKKEIEFHSIKKVVPPTIVENIISNIKTHLIKTLLKLEKEYGNLDSLDIDTSSKTEEEREAINTTVINNIYNDNSITIGNDNNIKNADILTGGDNNEQE
jgi:hypothetical protein